MSLSQINVNNSIVTRVDNEPLYDSKNLLQSGGTANKFIKIDGIGDSFADAGITEPGQIYYNTSISDPNYKKLRRAFLDPNTGYLEGETVPFSEDITYIYKDFIFTYNKNEDVLIKHGGGVYMISTNSNDSEKICSEDMTIADGIFFNTSKTEPFIVHIINSNTADDVYLNIGTDRKKLYFNGNPVSSENSWDAYTYHMCWYNQILDVFVMYPYLKITNELGNFNSKVITQNFFTEKYKELSENYYVLLWDENNNLYVRKI